MSAKNETTAKTIEVFWATFPSIWHQIREYIHEEAIQNFEITVGQFHALRRIHAGKDSVSTLAADKRASRAAISRVVDVLVNKGWVFRTTNPADRRNVVLALTEEGESLLTAVYQNIGDWMGAKLANLNETELENINTALQNLNEIFCQTRENE